MNAKGPLLKHQKKVKFQVDSKYSILETIGEGAFGVVCSAVDTTTRQKVAIKKICNIYDVPAITKRTLRELKILKHFKHDNIIAIKEIVKPPSNDFNDVYVVLDLMDTDLHHIIHSKQKLSKDHIVFFLYQLLRGLKYIHSAKIIHRDLKPSNLLVNTNALLKIGDFGMARSLSSSPSEQKRVMTEYVATRWYRAPELMLSVHQFTKAIDVWSVGCIFAEMLGRKALFPGSNYLNQLQLILSVVGVPSLEYMSTIRSERVRNYIGRLPHKEPVSFAQLYPDEPKEAIDLLSKFLVLDPRKRISVEEALKQPLVSKYHNLDDEPTCPVFTYDLEAIPMDKTLLRQHILKEILEYHKRPWPKLPLIIVDSSDDHKQLPTTKESKRPHGPSPVHKAPKIAKKKHTDLSESFCIDNKKKGPVELSKEDEENLRRWTKMQTDATKTDRGVDLMQMQAKQKQQHQQQHQQQQQQQNMSLLQQQSQYQSNKNNTTNPVSCVDEKVVVSGQEIVNRVCSKPATTTSSWVTFTTGCSRVTNSSTKPEVSFTPSAQTNPPANSIILKLSGNGPYVLIPGGFCLPQPTNPKVTAPIPILPKPPSTVSMSSGSTSSTNSHGVITIAPKITEPQPIKPFINIPSIFPKIKENGGEMPKSSRNTSKVIPPKMSNTNNNLTAHVETTYTAGSSPLFSTESNLSELSITSAELSGELKIPLTPSVSATTITTTVTTTTSTYTTTTNDNEELEIIAKVKALNPEEERIVRILDEYEESSCVTSTTNDLYQNVQLTNWISDNGSINPETNAVISSSAFNIENQIETVKNSSTLNPSAQQPLLFVLQNSAYSVSKDLTNVVKPLMTPTILMSSNSDLSTISATISSKNPSIDFGVPTDKNIVTFPSAITSVVTTKDSIRNHVPPITTVANQPMGISTMLRLNKDWKDQSDKNKIRYPLVDSDQQKQLQRPEVVKHVDTLTTSILQIPSQQRELEIKKLQEKQLRQLENLQSKLQQCVAQKQIQYSKFPQQLDNQGPSKSQAPRLFDTDMDASPHFPEIPQIISQPSGNDNQLPIATTNIVNSNSNMTHLDTTLAVSSVQRVGSNMTASFGSGQGSNTLMQDAELDLSAILFPDNNMSVVDNNMTESHFDASLLFSPSVTTLVSTPKAPRSGAAGYGLGMDDCMFGADYGLLHPDLLAADQAPLSASLLDAWLADEEQDPVDNADLQRELESISSMLTFDN